MIQTEQKIADAREVYETFWDSYLAGNVDTFASTLDDHFKMIGTSENEICHDKAGGIDFCKAQIAEVIGKVEKRNRQVDSVPLDGLVLISEFFDIYILIDTEWNFYSKTRVSTLLRETPDGWKIVQQHGSLPDNRVQDEETLAIDKISKENIELRDAVKRRTVELEAKNRELEIEAALERVRARTMAMQHSDELIETSELMFEQIKNLDIELWSCGFSLWYDDDSYFMGYNTGPDGKMGDPLKIPLTEDDFFTTIRDAKRRGADFLVFESEGESLAQTYSYMDTLPVVGEFMRGIVMAGAELPKYQVTHCGFFSEGHLMFITQEPNPEAIDIFKRFTKVFDQTYTRFLDLQKAEAQAREAQIEAALERVRSRLMAMHKSEELKDVVKEIFDQLAHLSVNAEHAGIVVDYEPEKDWHFWVAETQDIPAMITVPYLDLVWDRQFTEAKREGKPFFTTQLNFDEKNSFYKKLLPHVEELTEEARDFYFSCPGLAISTTIEEDIGLYIENFSGTPYSEEENKILKRFGKVFQQAYTRFLDLQKAEAQAREAEIQLALERVRARAMAMQKSDELSDVIALISEQMDTLQIPVDDGVALITFDEDSKDLNEWMANEGFETATNFHLPYFDHPVLSNLWEAKDQGQKELFHRYSAEESRSFLSHIFQHTDFSHTPEPVKEYCLAAETYATSIAFQKNTAIFINDYSGVSLSDSEMAILHRFAKEFDQTYTRFLDLQKAEAQARESEVNLAVERVRAKALAMFKSEEILQVVIKLRNEILGLNIPNVTAATIHLKESNGMVRAWDLTSINNEEGQGLEISLDITYRLEDTHPDFFMREVWKRTDDYFIVLQGSNRYKHTAQWLRDNGHAAQAQQFEEFLESSQLDKAYHPTVQLNNGRMCIDMLEPPDPEVESILKKMAGAFDLAYTRFLDLIKAEAQTREAQIEAALERARAQSMMMQHSDEINTISNAFHEQLVLLGIPSEFSYVWLPDEANETHQFWASWYEIKAGDETLQSKQVTYPLDKSEPYTSACFAAWASPDVILEEFIPPQDITVFFDVWQELLSGAEKLKPEYFQEGIYYSEAYMRYGCFGINIRRKLSEEEKNILKRFSKEFERAYTRFLDLQKAEEHARLIREERDRLEVALNKLEATQDQLIQQEKLASLGQLTAGIAHEIKNPLNFVNNFSDVSIELVEEARDEVRRGTGDGGPESERSQLRQGSDGQTNVKREKETPSASRRRDGIAEGDGRGVSGSAQNPGLILDILDDIEANLRKIHEHGSRADSIVKSMLQHSRGGNGKMEPTPLNPLIKEYVNLAFHGMRAGNEPINVDIDLQLDDKIGDTPIVAEDFSRVILNLCNNGFDAMREKLKLTGDGGPETGKKSPFEGGAGVPDGTEVGDDTELGYAPKLTVRTDQTGKSVTIEIEDNGPGIPDEIRDKIMQPFFTTKKGTQGTGLGLSITNDIVKAHGGELSVTSQKGTGTTFMIKLPQMD